MRVPIRNTRSRTNIRNYYVVVVAHNNTHAYYVLAFQMLTGIRKQSLLIHKWILLIGPFL